MSLQEEIDRQRGEIRTDGYSVSIGEWISIYEKKELDIHPEFQRFFRWTDRQKSRLIESILLGIPIPQIFVAQRPDGVWDVVDGVQRLSTIFQFVGVLCDEDGRLVTPLTLEATDYLPSMSAMRWEDIERPDRSLTPAQRLIIKRSKIDVSIILKESDEASKYELFQRLNSGGSQLSDQELRNSIIVMLNKDFYRWMKELSDDSNFLECVALSDRSQDEQYGMELVLRFLSLRTLTETELSNVGDMGEFLTQRAITLARNKSLDIVGEQKAFRVTFAVLKECLGSDSFRRYEKNRDRFLGGFSVSAYEAISLGVGYNIAKLEGDSSKVVAVAKALWSDATFLGNSGSGVRASTRVPRIVPLGRQLFAQ